MFSTFACPAVSSTESIIVSCVKNAKDIKHDAAREILVQSFTKEWQKYLEYTDIDKTFTSWREVEIFYSKYYDKELVEFQSKEIDFWIEAHMNGKLVGWATFMKDTENAAYMNLLCVHPSFQHRGIGQKLVTSLMDLSILPNLDTLNILLRIKNQGGEKFYTKLGFTPSDYKRPGNFVDNTLLQGYTCSDLKLASRNVHIPKIK